jgi:hypothetical protein
LLLSRSALTFRFSSLAKFLENEKNKEKYRDKRNFSKNIATVTRRYT